MIRKCLSAGMAVLSIAGLPAPAMAQDPNAQLQSLRQIYAISTYSLGADEVCQILDIAELRAHQVLGYKLIDLITRLGGQATIDSANMQQRGAQEANDCALNSDAKDVIQRGRVIARALIDAPAYMKTDPAECKIDVDLIGLSRKEWAYVPRATSVEYDDPELETLYQTLRSNFADFIDQDCAEGPTKVIRMTSLLTPGYEKLRQIEDFNILSKGLGENKVYTSLGQRVLINPVSKEFGYWRSQRSKFTGTLRWPGTDFYRVVEQGDVRTGFAKLNTPGMFGIGGTLYFTTGGRWIAKINENIEAVELRLSDGKSLSLAKVDGRGTGFASEATFELSKSDQKRLSTMDDTLTATVAFREKDSDWRVFAAPGRDAGPQTITLGEVREGLAWATAPRPAKD